MTTTQTALAAWWLAAAHAAGDHAECSPATCEVAHHDLFDGAEG